MRERSRVLAQADERAKIHMARSLHEQKESPKGDFANEGAEWFIQSHANEGAEWYKI